MIVFIDNPKYAGLVSARFNRPTVIENLSSLYSGYIDVSCLITKLSKINNTAAIMPQFVDSYEFDMQFANGIFNDLEMYQAFMQIMVQAYEGAIVCILVQRDFYRDAVMESLIKLIQQKYTINCWIIESEDDIDVISEQPMYPMGVMALDNDIANYINMRNKGMLNNVLQDISIE